jgi:hypothetical protein
MHDPAKLRGELDELNQKCLVARDNEVRYALQRSRLEAERAQLLARLVVAQSLPQPAVPYHVVVRGGDVPTVRPEPHSRPDGTPDLPSMVLGLLRDSSGSLLVGQIVDGIRGRWWPEIPSTPIYTTVYRLRKSGRIERHGDCYRAVALGGVGAAARCKTVRKQESV